MVSLLIRFDYGRCNTRLFLVHENKVSAQLNTEDNLFLFCKELHNKDLQTLKKSHQDQTKAAENMVQNLVSFLFFVILTFLQQRSSTGN